jgi:uncharacterized membrane protein
MVEVNRALYWVLVVGMVASTSLFVLGLLTYAIASLQRYSEEVLLGATVVLLATPVTRAFVGTAMFTWNGDRRAAMVAGVVSLILLLSIVLGFVYHLQS